MFSPGRKLITACLIIICSLATIYICGCAAALIEGAEAGEAAAVVAEAETAPALGAAFEASAFDDLWLGGRVPTFDVSLEEDIVTQQIGKSRFSIDLGSGNVRTESGVQVAQIEGSRIYRVYPRGTHELAAEIETRLVNPVTAYSDPTVLDRVRVLRTGDLVQVVRVERGWYQLRYVDHDISVLLWVFAPALVSDIHREFTGGQYPQSISFRTRVPTRELMLSTLESTEKLRSDMDNFIPAK